ncbi:acyltransferase [Sandaracinobacter sp. RS1-74]|uniref:acyltransferase family protein n=1 Tax=Sandaracinobacteroides sayramensis TaxID=2913411 RepID=UPI001EDC49E8|nr:acyltransferase [Sandaracinobacteroides sayramensis]MCG2841186.1 acyltransferase [Sandaracinobacteroides sayramensis]
MTFRPNIAQLDGLRAIAILAVMVFHLDIFPIGWMGVPLFFVLSGYLITDILIYQKGRDIGSYLKRFYWRRTIRIFPLYYAYLAVNAILSLAVGLSLSGYVWFLLYLGNYRIGALAPEVPGGIIGHLWSLAIEEQFYLIWPFLLFYVRRVWVVALVALIAAPLIREWILQATGNPYMAILTLPSCMDMLAAGALVAVVKSAKAHVAMALAGAVIIFWCFATVPFADFALTSNWVPEAHIIYTGLGLFFAPVVANAVRLPWLDSAPLVWVGQISYGLYMWHLLAFVVAKRIVGAEWTGAIAGFILSFVIAALSWYLFEKPLLKLKDRGPGA